jgi:hypothetical protein
VTLLEIPHVSDAVTRMDIDEITLIVTDEVARIITDEVTYFY